MAWRAAVLAALLASCSPEEESKAPGNTQQGMFVTLHSEDVIAGRRPTLTLSCAASGGSFWLELSAASEDPRRPVFGIIKLDDGSPVRMELTTVGEGRWAPRLDHRQESGLVRAMAAANNIYFHGPEGRTDRVIRWDLGRLGASAAQVRAACASIPARP